MKRQLFCAMLVILSCSHCACREDIDEGLVAYYPFDGNARDQIAKGNDGLVDGARPATDRFGNKDRAYSFDGAKASILAQVAGMPASDAPQSLSWWYWIDAMPVFADTMGAGNMVVLVDPLAGVGIQAGFRGPGYHSRGLDTWKWGGGTLLEVEPPEVNVWHHCVYTFDGLIHRFYLDGRERAHSTESPQHGNPRRLMFGNYPGGEQFFAGRLDDVRIYNRPLSKPEIAAIYSKEDWRHDRSGDSQ